jgi:hypothetical protein
LRTSLASSYEQSPEGRAYLAKIDKVLSISPLLSDLIDKQEPLGAEFEKVLYDNLPALYETEPAPLLDKNDQAKGGKGFTKEWCIRMAELEGNSEIGVGHESLPQPDSNELVEALREISTLRGCHIRSMNWSGESYENGCVMAFSRCADIADAALAQSASIGQKGG